MEVQVLMALGAVLMLYSYSIKGFRRRVRLRYCAALTLGVVLDWYASAQMYLSGERGFSTHGVIGAAALVLMTLLLIPAGWYVGFVFMCRMRWPSRSISTLQRLGIYAYWIWIASLATGTLIHMGVVEQMFNW